MSAPGILDGPSGAAIGVAGDGHRIVVGLDPAGSPPVPLAGVGQAGPTGMAAGSALLGTDRELRGVAMGGTSMVDAHGTVGADMGKAAGADMGEAAEAAINERPCQISSGMV